MLAGAGPAYAQPMVEAIDIVGNDKTSAEVILERFEIRAGEPLDDVRIEETRLRLLATGFFSQVDFRIRRGSARGKILLVCELVERNTIVVDGLYFGHTKLVPFFGGFGLAESNFLGKGVSVRGGFVVGKDRHSVDFNLFVPDVSGTPLQLTVSGIWAAGEELLAQGRPEVLTYTRVGGAAGIGVGVGAAQRVLLEYRLESMHTELPVGFNDGPTASAPSVLPNSSVLSTLTLLYEYDTRDDAFVASRGWRALLAAELGTSLIGSDYEFSKYVAEAEYAFLAFGRHPIRLGALLGFIQGQTPFFNQFFLGDYAYFTPGRKSLARAGGVNFSSANDYDDIVVQASFEYNFPIPYKDSFLFRTYVYAGLDVALTSSLNESQVDPESFQFGSEFPLSVDVGVRMDTLIGRFVFSAAYFVDLVL